MPSLVPIIFYLALVAIPASAEHLNFTCIWPPPLLTESDCGQYIKYHIPSDINVTEMLEAVEIYSDWQSVSRCPYFANTQYQCYKLFPHCLNDTSVDPPEPYYWKMCKEPSCYDAKKWDNGFCLAFPNSYFTDECEDSDWYADSDCFIPDLDKDGSNDKDFMIQIILASIAAAVGLAIGCSLFICWCRRRYFISPELTQEDIDRPLETVGGIDYDVKGPDNYRHKKKKKDPEVERMWKAIQAGEATH